MDAFTAINPNLVGFDPSNVGNALLGGGTAFTFDPSSFAMVSGDTSAAFYDGSLALGIGAGLIITSGTLPGATNTAGYFGVSNNMPGDPMLDAVVNSVFPAISLDATTISFSFTVDDLSITGVSFNVVFGSDEYPEWVNQFVDVAAIWVNGTNVAYFNNDPAAPLSVIGSNLSSNYFINNTGNLTTPSFGGVARPGVTSLLPIEYDGVSAPLTVYAPVHQGVNTLKIGIADTRDHIYDSGMFISNMLGTSIPVTGITRDIDGSGDNDLLQGSADAEDIHGNLGDDEIRAAGGNDVILADDGNDYITAGAGDDYVDGGAGNDVAVYSGASTDYSITANADGTTTVTDLRDFSPDGSDTLKGVEAVQFSDIAIDLATMLETAKTAAPQTTVPVGAPPALIPADGALPAVTAPITVFTLEDGETEGVNAFENIEADPASLTVAFAPGAQLPGVSYNATTHKFLLDTSDASFQSLAAGEQTTLAVDYTVSNSASSTDASIVYTVTGTNDAPVVAAAAVQVTQGAAPVTVDGLANASDVDNGAVLSVVADLGFGADDTGVDPGAPETEVHGNSADAPAGQAPAFTGGDYTLAALPAGLTFDALTGQFTLDPADPAFATIPVGQTRTITLHYGVSDGTAVSSATAVFTIAGTYDAPIVSGPVLADVTEDSALISIDALATTTDLNPNAILTITNPPPSVDGAELEFEGPDDIGGHGLTGGHGQGGHGQGGLAIIGAPDSHTGIDGAEDVSGEVEVEVEAPEAEPLMVGGSYSFAALPPGVTFDAPTNSFVVDPTDAAFQYLAAGEQTTITIHYGVSDGTVVTAASAIITLTGTNDAPVVTGSVGPLNTHEDGGARGYSQIGLLSNVTDVDYSDTLTAILPDTLPTGMSAVTLAGALVAMADPNAPGGVSNVMAPSTQGLMIDPADASFQSLAQGEELIVQVPYTVTDGSVSVADMAAFRVVGTNDAPVVSGPVTTALGEDDATVVSLDALANASDVDHGAVLTVTSSPDSFPYFGDSHFNEQVALGIAPEIHLDPASLPAGVTYDAAHGVYTFDPNDPNYKGLGIQPVRTLTDHYNPNNIAPAHSDRNASDAPVNKSLPDGITFDAATNAFVLDPTNPAIQSIPAGQLVNMIVDYGVSDGFTTTAASVAFAITGANDAPVVSGPLVASTSEDSGGLLDRATLLSIASDIDVGDRLSLDIDETQLPEHVTYNHVDGSLQVSTLTYYGFTQTVSVPTIDTLTIDTSAPEFQSLAKGETRDVVANYSISDGAVSVPAQAIFHVVGVNDAPVVAAPVAGATTEDSAPLTLDGLANASDVDHGAVLSVVAVPPPASEETENFLNGAGVVEGAAPPPPPILPFDPAILPAGVTFDPATNSFTLDPSDPAYQSLAAGQTTSVTVTYGVSDGIIATAATATFTVTGTNDAPVASGPVTGLFVNEDGQPGAYDLPALLSTTTDVDQGDKLAVIVDTASLPAGVSYVSTPESVIPGHTIPAFVIPAGPRGTSWGAYVYPAQFVPAQVVPDQIVPATSKLSIDPSDPSFQSLAEGEEGQVVVHYQVTDGLTAIPVDAILTVNGMNDAPVVSAAVTGAATEGGATVTLDGLANASDVDHGTTLHVMGAPLPPVLQAIGVGPDSPQDLTEATALAAAAPLLSLPFDPATLPAGVTYDPAAQTFTLDPTDPAYQSLSVGQTKTVTINYGVSDGITTTAAKASFTVTGTNQAPVVGSTPAYVAAEDSAAVTLNPLANVTDVDQLDVLKVVAAPLPAGIRLVTIPGAYYQPPVTITTFNPADASFQSLAAGETETVVWNYTVTDGHVSVADSASFTVTGVNDAPMQTGFMGAVVTEDGAAAAADGLAGMVDVDHGSVISLVNVPAILPAGVTFDAASHSFAINPADAAFQGLAQGEVLNVSVPYGVTDGLATTTAHVDFAVIGVNDAPVVTGPVTGSPNEDGTVVTVVALGNATDIDGSKAKDGLHVTGMPTVLPAGVDYDAATQRFSLDPSNAAYQSLSLGETATVSVGYSVSDGYVDVPTSVVFSVSGRNDAPVVSGAVQGGTVTAQGSPVTMNLLANASDVDHLDTLTVNATGGNKVTATVSSGIWAAPVAFTVANNQVTVDPKQFATLGVGKTVGLSFGYQVTDGNPGGSVADTASLTIQGNYAGPTGVALTAATSSLAKAQSGSSIGSKSLIINVAQTGGLAGDAYSYTLGGAGAAAFTLSTTSGNAQISTGNSPVVGAAGGKLYALSVMATDTTAGMSTAAAPLNVVVGQGSGAGVVNLAALPSMATAAPTFVYDLGGSDQINGTGMTGRLLIDGGQGADVMTGGSGANTYLYGATTDSTISAMDIINNFHVASDLIDLTGLGTKFTAVGALATGATSLAGTSVGWQTSGGNTFLYVNTTGKSLALGSASMKIELIGDPSLVAGNIAHF